MTMACHDAELLLWRRIDEELDGAGARALDEHLESCPACCATRGEIEEEDALIGAAFADHPFDAALQQRILAQIAREKSRPAPLRFPRPLRFLSYAAAAALLIAALWQLAPETIPGPAPSEQVRVAVAEAGLLVQRGGSWQTLAEGAVIRDREQVQNASPEPLSLRLENGSAITLRPEASLKIRRGADGGTEVDLRNGHGGEVLCSVTPGHGIFRVQAHDLTATVLGTRFLVRSFPGLSRVVVLEGRVECRSPYGSQILTRNQEAERAQQRFTVQKADVQRRSHWLARPEKTPARSAGTIPARQPPAQQPAPRSQPTTKPAAVHPGLDMPMDPPRRDPAPKDE